MPTDNQTQEIITPPPKQMRRFFTADWHLNSTLFISKGLRKFKSAERMNQVIIRNANRVSNKWDTIIHVGDFCCQGNDQGCPSIDVPTADLLAKINANFVNIRGNHDINNGTKSICNYYRTTLGQFTNVSVGHYPSNNPKAQGTFKPGDLHLCGHVHGAWKYMIDHKNQVLNINVGIDVWNYQIVSEEELLNYVTKIMREKIS